MNFSKVLRHHADHEPDREVLIAGSRRITWGELDRRVDALAAALAGGGLARGDRLAILLYNCPEHIEIIFAANRLGAVFLPLNWRLAGEELFYILDHSGARGLISEAAYYD
ncbi:MAG: AMP-binding protein, partial [Chloroflexi bacterium]|nr:AMP-binding protein [Chloroflexota bacterium]